MAEKQKRYVITGAPNSGKTSVISCLEQRVYSILPESARTILNRKRIDGQAFEGDFLNHEIWTLQKEVEEVAFKFCSERIFLDRSIIDSYAYVKLANQSVPKSFNVDPRNRYDLVFLFDRLPFRKDEIRRESGDGEAQKIQDLLEKTYRDFGYSPIRVPIFAGSSIQESVAKRADFIINEVRSYESQ